MKVISAHVEKAHLRIIDMFVGQDGLFASRSELLRFAIQKYLINKLSLIRNIEEKEDEMERIRLKCEEEGKVMIPKDNHKEESEKQYTTYKILRKLEY